MQAIVREIGKRPAIATRARINAPQGAMALADLFADQQFADLAIINIDWEGDGFTPALVIDVSAWYQQWPGQPIVANLNVSIDDAFEQDNMDNGGLRDIVESFKVVIQEKLEIRRATGRLY